MCTRSGGTTAGRSGNGRAAQGRADSGERVKVLVCGSREFTNPFTVSLAIDQRISQLPVPTHIIHGDAPGADRIAAAAGERHGHNVQAFPADWETHGLRAGILRNLAMLDEKPDLVIAYWNGKNAGTAHTIKEAGKRGIPVEVIRSVSSG